MSTYAIGDVHGCFSELMQLLELFNYDAQCDQLWFVGDLVNRGSQSLDVLRFVKNLPNTKVVLGNHDLHLLAIYHQQDPLMKSHSLHEVLQAHDCAELIDWLRKRPLLYHDERLGFVMTHAGIYPFWTLDQAKLCAKEVETVLRGDDYVTFLTHMYGNEPNCWSEQLTGNQRLRFILNAFVRMRFASQDGILDFEATGSTEQAPVGFVPWYQVRDRKPINQKIVFGHWAALRGQVNVPNIYAIDEGCVWGSNLVAVRLESGKQFRVHS